VTPVSTGKPDPTMHRESVERSGARRPLVVGDRLDTDIEGARAVGCASLLVLTGVTTAADLIAAHDGLRPDYLAADLTGVLHAHPAPEVFDDGTAQCGNWLVRAEGDELHLSPAAEPRPHSVDDLDPLRALCTAAWAAPGGDADRRWACRADGDAAAEALGVLELA
jgi:hypothetical protein